MAFDSRSSIDPFRRGFHALETFNEEHLAPDRVLFPTTPLDAEIVTYVLEGSLIREENYGRQGSLGMGEFECAGVRGGKGRLLRNGSATGTALVFQGGLSPGDVEAKPVREQKRFPAADREGVLRLVVSPGGRDGSLRLRRDVEVYSSILLLGHHLIHELGEGRGAWLQVLRGRVLLREHELGAGDGAALEGETSVAVTARGAAEILLFDLA